jgi:hypothetical protein
MWNGKLAGRDRVVENQPSGPNAGIHAIQEALRPSTGGDRRARSFCAAVAGRDRLRVAAVTMAAAPLHAIQPAEAKT